MSKNQLILIKNRLKAEVVVANSKIPKRLVENKNPLEGLDRFVEELTAMCNFDDENEDEVNW